MAEPFMTLQRLRVLEPTGFIEGRLTVYTEGAIAGHTQIFSTRERGVDWVFVRIGKYTVAMSHKKRKPVCQCLRFKDLGCDTILIHRAFNDDPKGLEGCIAPFLLAGSTSRFGRSFTSEEAMLQIFECLGGFRPTKTFAIYVINNVPGAVRKHKTKTPWLNARLNNP